jgi:hypothetical protein
VHVIQVAERVALAVGTAGQCWWLRRHGRGRRRDLGVRGERVAALGGAPRAGAVHAIIIREGLAATHPPQKLPTPVEHQRILVVKSVGREPFVAAVALKEGHPAQVRTEHETRHLLRGPKDSSIRTKVVRGVKIVLDASADDKAWVRSAGRVVCSTHSNHVHRPAQPTRRKR